MKLADRVFGHRFLGLSRWQSFRHRLSERVRALAWRVDYKPQHLVIRGEDAEWHRGPSLPRPEIGEAEFLVYADCRCGWRAACPEGSFWPRCPHCGKQVLPVRTKDSTPLGYVAFLMAEERALRLVEMKPKVGE